VTVRSVAVITGGLSQPSSSRLLADQLGAATDRALRLAGDQADIEVIELRELAHDLANNLLTGFAAGELATAIHRVANAEAVIAVTPIFSASYSGLFKTFFDVLEEGVLAGKPVLIGATGGTARHSLALEFAVRPMFVYLKAIVAPTSVFGASEDFGKIAAGGSSLADRVDRAGRELADLIVGNRPSVGPVDPFDNPTPFEELLSGN
jgi:FMN reductase